ncbi:MULTISPECIES: cation diffusion facilitator family transporter [unclassified Streptomyces]|uniref:cation diffusion facilitator family transporter n=1 Tax=unclassified Streptomyces TaxID=2593676 RepID=UPI000DBABAAE|nr:MULTISPECIES: cation diffusion facilitator family transporter [unclassified Streptomyces]MYT71947.1 cation diffusion facilitator family transporter [Streptomyces sp. SID8367]RAJ75328.1 cobalt-zinc-cadmium efflux system protein [Streptomyces sp. PsTaAH-137]
MSGHDHGPAAGHTDGPGSEHDHGGHGHAGHGHGVSADADRRWLALALTLITGFMAVEVVVGVVARSLALISDAAHMLTDAASIVLALVAMRLAARPAKGRFTYGLKRAEILSAQANGLTLLLLGVWLAYEAVRRLVAPPEVAGGLMLATALAGIVVNVAATWCLSRANRSSLNVEGAYQHILNDLFAFIGTAVAALIVVLTGFARADAIATLVVVVLMVKAGYGLLRDSGRIFLEAAPAGLDPDALGDRLVAQKQVVEVHDLHVWQITSGQAALSAHVLVEPGGDCHAVRRTLGELLRDDYGITHTTLQVDHAPEPVLQVARADAAGADAHCADSHGPVHREEPHAH